VIEGTKAGPGILVTGHDLMDLWQLLQQVEGTDINLKQAALLAALSDAQLERVLAHATALDLRKSVIASRLSIKPETWSRITRRLAEDGVIAVDGQRITILDLAALQALADEVGSA